MRLMAVAIVFSMDHASLQEPRVPFPSVLDFLRGCVCLCRRWRVSGRARSAAIRQEPCQRDVRIRVIRPMPACWRSTGPALSFRCFEHHGRALNNDWPPEHDLRDIMDAIFCVDRTGVQ